METIPYKRDKRIREWCFGSLDGGYTIGRAQGWSDSPLTPFGEEGIRELGVGLKAAGIPFKVAYSSDSCSSWCT